MKHNITICQIGNPDVFLPCEEKVGSLRCEQLDVHDRHWLGDHTIQHKILGTKYSCEEVDEITSSPSSLEGGKKAVLLPKLGRKRLQKVSDISGKSETYFSKRGLIAFVAVIIIAPILLALLWMKFDLGSVPEYTKSGNIVAKNHDIVPFKGQYIEGTNTEQKALAIGKDKTTPPAFIFTNGEDSAMRKDVHVYVSFSDQASRDFLNLNAATLRAFVESGKIDLYVHVVPATDPFGLYAPEVLAEGFYYAPEYSWGVLIDLLKFANENYNKDYDADELAKRLAELANNAGAMEVTADGIQNGTFTSWLYSLGTTGEVARGMKLPSVYIGEKNIPIKSLDLTGNDSFNEVLGLQD